ncbi:MAG: sigma-54-dependent Fis family transcriptional regulator [Firmicutes bacterium]|nr:sigma-54-dependent Fis family transcriptional regulator [Bacillota bacterium]
MAVPYLLEWKQFRANQKVDSTRMRPAIMESWTRCHQQGVDRIPGALPPIAPAADLDRRLERYQRVLDAAEPYLKELARMVRGSGFVVTLSDPEGIVLHSSGDAKGLSTAERTGMVVGANWSEAGMGTNAIGLALVLRESMDVVGAEHYLDRLHPLACAAAPVWSPMGELLGIIDLTGPWFHHHAHTLALVELAARAVQRELGRWLGDSETLWRIVQAMGESTGSPCLLVDAQGTIRYVSDQAARLLGVRQEALAGRSIHDLVAAQAADRWFPTAKGGEILAPVQAGSRPVLCILRSHRVECPEVGGYLVTVERAERKRVTGILPIGFSASYTLDSFVGRSPGILQLKEQARKVAATDLTVLILGETGTGKELLAHAIHAASPRCHGPFVAVNCAAIPESLLESELFGYEPGAFTGASPKGKRGKFQLASGGTLFLDEIGDMPLGMQAALLRVLQDRQVVRVGGSRPIPVDVRIIAATNKDLHQAVAEGTFRRDLLYRLDVLTLRIPPLRERPEDVPLLVEHFARRLGNGKPVRFSPAVLAALQRYDWPGNVRELENTVAKCLYATEGNWVDVSALPPHLQALASPAVPPAGCPPSLHAADRGASAGTPGSPPPAQPSGRPSTALRSMAEAERAAILSACEEARGNLSLAARLLGISRPTLYRKLRQFGIPLPLRRQDRNR